MDERHWWVAAKIQQTFKIGKTYQPEVLESYLSEEKILVQLDKFFEADSPKYLFVYRNSKATETRNITSSLVLSTETLFSLAESISRKDLVFLYFLRKNTDNVIDKSSIYKEVLCGEIKGDPLKIFSLKLAEIFLPFFKNSKDWSKCCKDRQKAILQNIEKYSEVLNESVSSGKYLPIMQILKMPAEIMTMEQRMYTSPTKTYDLESKEQILAEWIANIETILYSSDERTLENNLGPLSELKKWRSKYEILENITEQLKGRECKSVISCLVAGRSKMLRKWKLIDSGISEAINESRDKVKYLEFIKSHLLELQNTCCPEFVMFTIIPNIIAAIKRQDSLTRHFARSGFLALLLKKIANQLAIIFKKFIKLCTTSPDGDDIFGKQILQSCYSLNLQQKNIECKYKEQVNKTVTESLYKQVKSCIQMTNSFRNSITMLQSTISVRHGTSLASRSASHISLQPSPNLKMQRASTTNISDFCRTIKGNSLLDKEAIFSNLDPLIHKMKKIIYIIETFSQFSVLTKLSASLPVPKSEDLDIDTKTNDNMLNENEKSAVFQPMYDIKDHSLLAIKEEDVQEEKEGEEKLEEPFEIKKRKNLLDSKEEYNSNDHNLKTYFADKEESSPILLNIFGKTVTSLKKIIQKITTADILHIDLDESDEFNSLYREFQSIITESELLIESYLDVMFRKDLSVEQSLDILNRFSSVSKRTALVRKIERCYVKVFNHYTSDLLEQCDVFQQNKENPPMSRNSPKVAGTIQWCKFTLKKIKYPMEILMNIRAVHQLPHFSNFVKIYNEAVTSIKDFERKTIGSWMKSLVNVVNGLSASLLTYHLESKELLINFDPRLLIAIEETKSMAKMGVPISRNAKAILLQEDKLRNYKMHLELCIYEFDETKGIFPKIWQQLFKEHYCQMSKEFQPGLSSLSWNSLNIDAFLYKIRSAGHKLRDMTHNVQKIICHQIEEVIEQMEDMSLFSVNDWTFKHQHYEDVQKTMFLSIEHQTVSLNNHIHTLQNAIQDILNIVTTSRISPKYWSKGTTEDKLNAGVNELLEEDKNQLSKKIIACYRDKLCHAVKKVILRSLMYLQKSVSTIEGSGSKRFCSPPGETTNLLTENSSEESHLECGTYLHIKTLLVYNIPDFTLDPPAAVINNVIRNIALKIRDVSKGIPLNDVFDNYFHAKILKNERINNVIKAIEKSLSANESLETKYIQIFNRFDFLWTRNRYENFNEFLITNPSKTEIQNKIEDFIAMEKELARIPQIMEIGLLSVKSDPVKQSLQALILSWKTLFTSVLHTDAYNMLKAACSYRKQVLEVLSVPTETLEQLNNILYVLQQIRDMQNKIDQIYLPIELTYHTLMKYGVPLPRSEIKEVEELRSNWSNLIALAETTEKYLFTDKRLTFEQEICRENMAFVVKVMQFRNSFDGEGPNIPDLSPEEAVERLNRFQEECLNLKKEREILETVSKTFGVTINTFTELDQTEEDLKMIDSLYDLYMGFIQFDDQFQNTLWCDVDFRTAVKMMELFWDDYLLLSGKLQDYSAYHNLKTAITMYQETIPILKLLHSKTIRNRHWLQVMAVTENTFPLEVTVLRLSHLFNINLPSYKSAVIEICQVSMKEMELEMMMSKIEEEWTEQELIFQNYKTLGQVTLDQLFTERLLEQLEDSQVTLANMLTSPYISPMQKDVSMWTEKLKELGVVLEMWIDVQNLWTYLEAVFSNSDANKELQQESLIFVSVNTSWCRVMARSVETKNVLQACCGEIPLKSVLLHIQKDLESCSRSLGNYLEKKRMQFPRFFFLSNPVLLATLSCPQSLESILPSLGSLFGYISEIETEVLENGRDILSESPDSNLQFDQITETFTIPQKSQEIKLRETAEIKMIAVKSFDGEKLVLNKKVPVCNGVEWWINELKHTIHDTISKMSLNAIQEITQAVNLEEFIAKYPTQICQLAVLYLWSREVEKGIMEVKNERKALFKTYKKFCNTYNKLLALFNRSFSKGSCDTKSTRVRIRSEKLVIQTLYLRDTLDTICKRKVKHCTDFDWRRYLKCHLVPDYDTELKPHLEILDHRLVYGNEFCGSNPSIIITPVTDKCFLSIFLALQNLQPVCLIGTPDIGKKETIKSLSNAIAQFYHLLRCFPHFDPSSMQRIIQGSSMEGCWLCLADGNKLSHKCLDVVMDQVAVILDAVRVNSNVVKDIYRKLTFEVNPRTSFFMTVPFNEESDWHFARKIKSVFRTVSLLKPDTYYILRGYFVSAGFKCGNILAGRLLEIVSLAELQLSECQIPSFGLSSMIAIIRRAQHIRKTPEEKYGEKLDTVQPESRVSTSTSKATPSTTSRQSQISLAMKESSENPVKDIELSTLVQSIEETLCPALDNNLLVKFQDLVSVCIYGTSCMPNKSTVKSLDLENMISEKANQKNLTVTEEWIAKCLQLNSLSKNFDGVLVVGPSGSGKTTCLQTLVEAFNESQHMKNISNNGMKSLDSNNYKLIRINPMSFENLEPIFGWMDLNSQFIDGLFMSSFKKASKNNFNTWFLIDSHLNDDWLDQLTSMFSNKQIQLKNGDRVAINGNVKTFIETDSLDTASPMTIAKLGMAYFDGLVTWEVLTKSWIKARKYKNLQINGSKNGYDIAEILMQCYQTSMDPVIQFFKTEIKDSVHFNEVGMITTSLEILTVLLSNCHAVSGDTHIKKLFVFSLVWSFGGHLSSNDRLHFNEFLLKLRTNLIPEDENDVYLFDYFVDESGEWENWNIKSLEESPVIQDNFSREYVYTLRTIPIKYFINNFTLNGFPFLLSGPRGSGKTSLINAFMSTLDPGEFVLKKFVYSSSTTTTQLFDFFNSNVIHRQGFVYGAKDKKKLAVFIEDINIPKKDQYGAQRCNEFLRQILDEKVTRDSSPPFETRYIEDLCMIAEMIYPEPHLEQLNQRLLRHFAIFSLPEPEDNDISTILGKKLETAVNGEDIPSIDIKLFNNLVEASCQLLSGLQSTLKLSSLPGSTHYMFTIQSLEHCFKGLVKLPLKERTNESFIILLWIHDIQKVLLDSVCRNEDRNFFKQLLRTIVNDKWPDVVVPPDIGYFITIPSRNRPSSHSPLLSKPLYNVLYQTESLFPLEATIQRHIGIYNSDHPMKPLEIIPSEHVISQITKVHRVLTCSDRSHLLSVSSVVSDIVDIYMLTCEMTNTTTIQMEGFTGNDLSEVLKTAVKQAGSLNIPVAFIIKDNNLLHPLHLDYINNFLVIEDYTTLYSTEELSTLFQSLELQLKKDHLERTTRPAAYFCDNVKRNLHILIHLTPSNPLLSNLYREYPGILKGCQVNWLLEWSEETLISMTTRYLKESGIFHENNLRSRIIKCLTNIHRFMFEEYNKAPWAGNLASDIEIVQVKSSDCNTDPVKVFNQTVRNLPYTQSLLLDHIRLQHQTFSSSNNQRSYISTKTYEQLFHCFQYLINLKSNERKEKIEKINKALLKLKDTRERLQYVTKDVKFKTAEYNTAKIKSEEYLEEIMHKATEVESLKTQLGQNLAIKAILDSHQFTNFLDQADNKELLTNDDYDSYDEEFRQLMAENMEKKGNQIEENLAEAKKQVPYKQKCVELSKEKIYFWKSKIDRNCIESIRGFTNPPNLVVHIINIVLIMTGKLNPLTYFNLSLEDQEIQLISSGHYKDKFQCSWKAIQHILSESKKFIDLIHNFSFEQGLKLSIIQAISSYLSPQEIQINLQSIQTTVQSDVRVQNVCKILPGNGITVAAAKHASKDVAILLQYVLALIVYSTFCRELQELNESVKELEEQIFRNNNQNSTLDDEIEITSDLDQNMVAELSEEDIPVLEKEIESLQRPYREAVELKHSLEQQLQNKNDEIKATSVLLESLRSKESEWCSFIEKESSDTLIYNCIMASSFLSYCPPFNIQTREKICNQFKNICSEHGFFRNGHQVFEDLSLDEFLFPPLLRVELEMSSSLPTSKVFLENCCFFVDDKMWTSWLILCDPNCWALECQQIFLKRREFVEVSFIDLESQLETCLNEGLVLFVTNCDPQKLHNNQQLLSVIFAYKRFIQATHPFKMWIGDLEVECSPSFRLYLHTSSDASLISDALSPYLTIITFLQSYECLNKDLLLRCINQEKSNLKDERNHLLQEKWDKTKEFLETEDKLLMGLCQDVDLLRSTQIVKELTELVNQHSEIKERLSTMLEEEESVLCEATEHLSIIASQGAICYHTMQYMKQLHPLYQYPYSSFLQLFHSIIHELDCTNATTVADELTYLANLNMIQTLRYKDRIVFTLFLAFEIDLLKGNILAGEREFVIDPLTPFATNPSLENIAAFKNHFEWMPDEVFHNLQILATRCSWFTEIFVNMTKEGKDSALKLLFDSQYSEQYSSLLAKLNILNPLQVLCVWRALRRNAFLPEATSYINAVLGSKFVTNFLLNIPLVISMTTPTYPILVLTNIQSGEADVFFSNALKGQKYEMISLHVSTYSTSAETTLRKFIWQKMSQGVWIILKNAHNWPSLLLEVSTWLLEKPLPNTMFRCCLSVDANYKDFPSQLLNNCFKIFIDSPMHVKDHLQWSSAQLNPDILDMNSSMHWPLLLYNICLLYTTFHLRTNMVHGWENTDDVENINSTDLQESIKFAGNDFRRSLKQTIPGDTQMTCPASLSAIRYVFSEVIFGHYLQRTRDQICLKGMVEYLISVNSLKKDFEYSKLKYLGLTALYNSPRSLVNLQQELDRIPNQFLTSPLMCHLHKYQETLPRNEEYVLKQLDKLLTAVPPKTLHTYSQTSHLASTDGTTSVPLVVEYCPEPHVQNWRSPIEMWQLCATLIAKLPRILSKEYLLSRMSKLGRATIYNKFILEEIFLLYKIINEVKTSLQAVKTIFEGNDLGERFSEEIINVAGDILHQKIPHTWNKLIGETAPPHTIDLIQWIQQLQNRSVFLEKIIYSGREKMPSYWLGAFLRPRMFLSLFRREFISKMSVENSDYETITVHTVITGRDKDHIREPPAEGVFIYGIYTWDFIWDRMSGQVLDAVTKGSPVQLPVVHVYYSQNVKENIYPCPVYGSRTNDNKSVLEIDIYKENTPPTHWALQGIMATLQPF